MKPNGGIEKAGYTLHLLLELVVQRLTFVTREDPLVLFGQGQGQDQDHGYRRDNEDRGIRGWIEALWVILNVH